MTRLDFGLSKLLDTYDFYLRLNDRESDAFCVPQTFILLKTKVPKRLPYILTNNLDNFLAKKLCSTRNLGEKLFFYSYIRKIHFAKWLIISKKFFEWL